MLYDNLKNELLSKTWKKVIFKFEDKIPAFSARLSALITFFQVFVGYSFFKLSDSILSQQNI
jgi:hypothetical protein